MSKTIDYLKSIKDIFPIMYLVLILVGFFEKNQYYSNFDISIIDYLTLQELIFIFIPVGSNLLMLSFLFIIIFFSQRFISSDLSDKSKNDEKITMSKTQKDWFMLIFDVIVTMTPVFLLLAHQIYKVELNTLIGYANLWALFFIVRLTMAFFKKTPKLYFFIVSCTLLGLLVMNDVNKNNLEANKILAGKSIKNVDFLINNEEKSTNKYLLFIGQTKEYLFLRDSFRDKNVIYNKKNIDLIKTY